MDSVLIAVLGIGLVALIIRKTLIVRLMLGNGMLLVLKMNAEWVDKNANAKIVVMDANMMGD